MVLKAFTTMKEEDIRSSSRLSRMILPRESIYRLPWIPPFCPRVEFPWFFWARFESFHSGILKPSSTRIVSGLLGYAMANMKDIARIARVSLGTVSHVLNNSANVRSPLRKRVLDAVQAAGYQPSQLARGLRRDKTNVIGMVIPDITNPFFPGVVRGAEDIAFSNGYRLVLCNTDNDHSKELVHLTELRTYLPSGLIVIPSNFSDLTAQAESYRRAGTGVVCVDRVPCT